MTQPDVRLETVVKRFDGVVAVDGITLEIPSGSFFALLGPSGCGKTTTLRMIGGFEEPDEGAIYLGDRDVVGLPPYRRDVNTVFQSYALFPHLSIFDNVAFGLRRKGVDKTQVKGRVEEMLRLVGLTGLGGRRPRQLSGGQQQRVALARALVNRPQVLLLDEPLGRARPEAAQADAARAEGDPARSGAHVRPRHARSRRSDDDGGRDRGDEQGPDRAARAADGALREARDRVRRRVPRRLQPASRLGHEPRPSPARHGRRDRRGSRASGPAASRSGSAPRRSGSHRPATATTASPAPSRRPPTSASPRST